MTLRHREEPGRIAVRDRSRGSGEASARTVSGSHRAAAAAFKRQAADRGEDEQTGADPDGDVERVVGSGRGRLRGEAALVRGDGCGAMTPNVRRLAACTAAALEAGRRWPRR